MAAPAVPPPEVTTYLERFAGMPDPPGDDYTGLMTRFSAVANQLTPAGLRDLVLGSADDFPKVFAVFQDHATDPRVMILHSPRLYAASMGSTTSWDNTWFAMAGDAAERVNPTLVQFPFAEQPFGRVGPVVVPTIGSMPALIAALGATPAANSMLGPFAVGDPDTEQISTRSMFPIPKFLVPHVLNGTFTPLSFWIEVVLPHLTANPARVAQCEELIHWARIALTRVTTAAPAGGAAGQSPALATSPGPLTVPLSDALLRGWLNQRVLQDLPGLRAPAGFQHAALAQGAAIQQAVQQQTQAAATARAAATVPKSIQDRYPRTYEGLLNLTEVSTVSQVPQVWKDIANSEKKEISSILRNAFAARAREVDSGGVAPQVTPSLVTNIRELTFGDITAGDNLTHGLSLFTIVTASMPKVHQEAQRLVAHFDLVQDSNAVPTLGDTAKLVEQGAVIPQTMVQCTAQYNAYSVLLDVILGVTHRVATLFRLVARQFIDCFPVLEQHLTPSVAVQYIPRFMRSTQLAMTNYWDAAFDLGAATPLPNLRAIVDKVMERTVAQLPTLPAPYLQSVGDGRRPGATPPIGLPVPPPDADRAGAGAGGTPSVPDRNPHADQTIIERYLAWTRLDPNNTMGNLAGRGHRPKADGGGTELCLHYQLRGECNTGCRRGSARMRANSTHRALTEGEKAGLVAFLDRNGVP